MKNTLSLRPEGRSNGGVATSARDVGAGRAVLALVLGWLATMQRGGALRVACGLLAMVAMIACDGSAGAGAPAIATQPAPATVVDGAIASFSVTATGDAPLAYQWRRNGMDLTDGAGVAGATSDALALTAPFAFNASQISVRVSNATGDVVSSDALLTVTPAAPVITMQPASTTVMAGATATFSVTTSGGTAPVTYQWKRGGKAIAGATAASHTTAATSSADDGATFSVDVLSAAGTLPSAVATLTVSADGRTWGPPVEISDTAYRDRGSPEVAIDTSGNAVAVWRELEPDGSRNAAWASRYTAGGAWTPPATIDKPVGNSTAPHLAMTPSGTGIVAFVQSQSNQGGGTDLVTNRFTGTWGTPTPISTTGQNPGDVVVAVAPDSAATVVFTAADAMFSRAWSTRSTSAGAWDPSVAMAAGTQPGWAPDVAVAANGDALMTWTESAGGASATTLLSSRNVGSGWTAPALVSSDTGQVLGRIRVAAEPNGDMLAVWSQRVASVYTLRSARLSAATGIWSAPITLNDGMREVTGSHLAVDAGGNAVVVWYETAYGVVANRFSASTATWGGPVVVQARSTGMVEFPVPTVGIDAQGNAIATWVQSVATSNRRRLFASHSSPAGTWSAPFDLLVDPDAGALADETEVSVNAKGEAVVVWHQETYMPVATGIWARVYR